MPIHGFSSEFLLSHAMTAEHMTIEHGDATAFRWAGWMRSHGPMAWRRGVLVVAVLTIMAGLVTGEGYRLKAAVGPGIGTGAGHGTDKPTHADRLKAAFLYNFVKFTNWPDEAFANSDTPLKLCTFGAEGLHSALHRIQGKKVKSRILTTRHPASAGELDECHLIFFGAAEWPELEKIIKDMKHRPVLTVSEAPGFTRLGGIINLKTVNGKLQIGINVTGAEQAGLRFSSKLLRLSNVVRSNRMERSN